MKTVVLKAKRKQVAKKRIMRRWVGVGIFYCIVFVILILFIVYYSLKNAQFLSPLPQTTQASATHLLQNTSSSKTLEELLKKNQIAFFSITTLPDSSYVVILEKGEQVILSSKKDLKEQIILFSTIKKRLLHDGKKIKKLDLRFDKPVVIFE